MQPAPRRRLRRLAAAGARAGRRRDGRRLHRPAHRLRRRRPRPWRPPPRRSGSGDAGRRRRVRPRPRPLAGQRRRRPGRADPAGARRPRPRTSAPDAADDLALRRPGGPGGAGRAAAQPLRHRAARRAHQRPRPRRPGAARGLRARACAAASCWSRTTASSWPAASPGSSSSTSRRTRSRSTTAATTPSWRSARSPAGTPARRYEEFADTKADLVARARTQREWSSQGVRNAMKKSPDNDKIRRKAQHRVLGEAGPEGPPDGVPDRPARRGRGAAQGVGAAVQHRRGAAVQLGGRHPQRGDVCAQGDFTLGPVSLQVNAGERIGITGPNGAGKTTLLRLLLGRLAPDAGTASLGRQRRGRRDRPGPRRLRRGRCRSGTPFEAAVPELAPGRGPHPAGEVRAQGRPGRPARSAGSRRGSAPAPRWRCCRPAA